MKNPHNIIYWGSSFKILTGYFIVKQKNYVLVDGGVEKAEMAAKPRKLQIYLAINDYIN